MTFYLRLVGIMPPVTTNLSSSSIPHENLNNVNKVESSVFTTNNYSYQSGYGSGKSNDEDKPSAETLSVVWPE